MNVEVGIRMRNPVGGSADKFSAKQLGSPLERKYIDCQLCICGRKKFLKVSVSSGNHLSSVFLPIRMDSPLIPLLNASVVVRRPQRRVVQPCVTKKVVAFLMVLSMASFR